MKVKYGFLAFFVICALLFSSCDAFLDWGNEDNNKENQDNGNSAEDKLMFDRINALVDDEYYDRSPFNVNAPDEGNFISTGISVGVFKDGRFFFFNRGYNESEQRTADNRTPVTENSVFEIASLTKPYTGALLAYLSETVNLSTGDFYVRLDDQISLYFEIKPYGATNIVPTLVQLATHSSGFPDWPSNNSGRNYTLELMQSELENIIYEYEPGSQSVYSNFGVNVLGTILTKAYYGDDFPAKTFEDLLQELICNPLGFRSTTTSPQLFPDIMSNKALAHTFNGEPRTFGTWSSFLAPASAINSTSREIIKFLAMMIGEYVPEGITEFQKKAGKSFEQKFRLRDNGSLYMGLTWNIQPNRNVPSGTISPYANNIDRLGGAFIELFPVFSNRGQRYGRIYHHGGSLANQYSTFFVVSPETNAAVVVLMNNGGHRSKAERLALRILERALNPR